MKALETLLGIFAELTPQGYFLLDSTIDCSMRAHPEYHTKLEILYPLLINYRKGNLLTEKEIADFKRKQKKASIGNIFGVYYDMKKLEYEKRWALWKEIVQESANGKISGELLTRIEQEQQFAIIDKLSLIFISRKSKKDIKMARQHEDGPSSDYFHPLIALYPEKIKAACNDGKTILDDRGYPPLVKAFRRNGWNIKDAKAATINQIP